MNAKGHAVMEDGCRIAWQLDGPSDAPVLMLSNSLGTSMAMWTPVFDALSACFRVLRYDTRGHGESDVTPGDYGLDRLGRDAVALLDALEIAQTHVCGVSLGGMTAQWLGVFAAGRVNRLVLANTSPHMGPASAWQQRMAVVRSQGMAAISEAVLGRWFTPAFRDSSPDSILPVRHMLESMNAQGYSGCCAAIRDMDMRPLLPLIRAECMIIAGSMDPATPPEHAERLARGIMHNHVLMLPAAHLSNIEQPEAFAGAVLDFLGRA